ncbi:hypothetical protein EW146_g3155 [Bondarzewia mesenterica]|uniref:DASH complex subunit DAM1 n=1 Tax=Bondarzewia mesenterica TaxID=1095465 RepID=A0A4S4LYN0_9AGAM|nr:hypothetical protein EW146_g3155 [Bondarzewia mesenterica]
MAPGPTPHRTPLRRVSQGSLFALSRSGNNSDAPHGLGFLEPALSELADETDALYANVAGLRALGDSLQTFNESFASWLYVMNMNALTVDWPQAPTDASYMLAKRRAEEDGRAALAAIQAQQAQAELEKTSTVAETANETTFADQTVASSAAPPVKKVVKKKGKPKLSAKERKERNLAIEKTVSFLPLEFRGSDPALRRHIDMVIEALIETEGRGVKRKYPLSLPFSLDWTNPSYPVSSSSYQVHELIKPPDLNQARVNKCLIALVNRKIVMKDNSSTLVKSRNPLNLISSLISLPPPLGMLPNDLEISAFHQFYSPPLSLDFSPNCDYNRIDTNKSIYDIPRIDQN